MLQLLYIEVKANLWKSQICTHKFCVERSYTVSKSSFILLFTSVKKINRIVFKYFSFHVNRVLRVKTSVGLFWELNSKQ